MAELFRDAQTGAPVEYNDLLPEWVAEVVDQSQDQMVCRSCGTPVRFYTAGPDSVRWACDC